MRIALVEPYYGGSHRAWADGFQASSNNEVRIVDHEARFWKWRMHGGFLTLAEDLRELVSAGFVPDVVVASSMMDVAAFAGAIRPTLPTTPIATYFHESQFTYPLSPLDREDFTYQMKNWSSAAVSDLVIFNSEFHRDVFRSEASSFLRSFPDHRHVDRVDAAIDGSVVLPVGVELSALTGDVVRDGGPPLVMWNQRWEHDKGPRELLAIVDGLVDSGVEFSVALCGEMFVSVPPMFDEIADRLGERLVHAGYAERTRYVELLKSSSVVLSTADQEFFGIGVVEAIAAGAHPVLPDRLVYPERVDAVGGDPGAILFRSSAHAIDLISANLGEPADATLRQNAMQYDWTRVAPTYDAVLGALVDDRTSSRPAAR
ncbi:MAG: DUF3524 domain-containing protein [Acidimicrobiia bacterium]|nr:DUF3524 domain-containing protein [Acidimicrobiia bacterium]